MTGVKRDRAGGRKRLPMNEILDKIPGNNVSARARACGVSRQTYYSWLNESFKPRNKRARRLAKLTGLNITEIIDR